MKVNDLMVGDWVMCNHYQDMPFTKQFGVADFAKGEYGFCEPIPLTEEILVKNGFKYAYNEASEMQNKQLLVVNIGGHYIEVRLDKKNVAIWYDYDENESGFYSDVLLDLPRTVHQLQHLLRLCGIEKEIEL